MNGHVVESAKRATSSTTSISRVTSRARQVGTTTLAVAPVEAEPVEQRVLALLAASRGRSPRRRARAGSARPAAPGSSAVHVACRRPSARRRARRSARVASSAACGGEVRVDALLPAVRALGAQPEPLGRLRRCRYGSKFAASSSTSVVASRDLGLLAAHDPGERDRALGVGDQQVARVELAVDAVERAQRSPGRARRTTIRPPASFAKSNACSGLPSASIT